MSKIQYKDYLHGSKESNYGVGENLGLEEEALKVFMYTNYEVELDMEVDTETGESEIISVDGRKLV